MNKKVEYYHWIENKECFEFSKIELKDAIGHHFTFQHGKNNYNLKFYS